MGLINSQVRLENSRLEHTRNLLGDEIMHIYRLYFTKLIKYNLGHEEATISKRHPKFNYKVASHWIHSRQRNFQQNRRNKQAKIKEIKG